MQCVPKWTSQNRRCMVAVPALRSSPQQNARKPKLPNVKDIRGKTSSKRPQIQANQNEGPEKRQHTRMVAQPAFNTAHSKTQTEANGQMHRQIAKVGTCVHTTILKSCYHVVPVLYGTGQG